MPIRLLVSMILVITTLPGKRRMVLVKYVRKATKPQSMRMAITFATKLSSLKNAQKVSLWATLVPDHIATEKVILVHLRAGFKKTVSAVIVILMKVNIILETVDASVAELPNAQRVDIRNTSKSTTEDIVDARDLQLFMNYAERITIHGNTSTSLVTQPWKEKTEEKLPIHLTLLRLWLTLETVPMLKVQVMSALATWELTQTKTQTSIPSLLTLLSLLLNNKQQSMKNIIKTCLPQERITLQ